MENDNATTVHAVGVDIGRVLIAGDGPDSTFLGVPEAIAMAARPVDRAFDGLAALVARYEGRVYLVSKCGPGVEKKSRAWLEYHDVYRRTGLSRDHLHFCRERKDKVGIAQRLRLDAFIDDRADVLLPMRGTVPVLLHFGAAHTEPGLLPAPTWPAVLASLVPPR